MTPTTHDSTPRATGWRAITPNALVALRLALAAIVFAILATWTPDQGGKPLVWATIIFIVAAVTDALDGALARRWNAITTFGRIMDPFADKVLVLGGFVLLAGPTFSRIVERQVVGTSGLDPEIVRETVSLSGVVPWMVVVILARELLVTSIRGMAESKGLDFSASLSGKLKMILQSIAVPLLLLLIAMDPTRTSDSALLYDDLTRLIAWTTTLVTLWSAIPYIQNGVWAFTGGPWFKRPKHDPLSGRLARAASLLTVGGLGFLKPAPGTWGSLPPVVLAGIMIALGYTPWAEAPVWGEPSGPLWFGPVVYHVVLTAVLIGSCLICVMLGDFGEGLFGKKDAGQIVADETAGQCIVLAALPITASTPWWQSGLMLALAFFAFRGFDILKLPPANALQKLPGGWGVLVDDLVAGVQALLVTQGLIWLLLSIAG